MSVARKLYESTLDKKFPNIVTVYEDIRLKVNLDDCVVKMS